MNLDLTDLRAFMAVSELGSFHAAADTLHLSQSALSRRIVNLEKALGVRLFERTTRRVGLTLAGRELSHKARSLLDHLESSLLGIRDLTVAWKSEFAIACVPSAVYHFLPSVLLRYHAKSPKVKVRIMDTGSSECLSLILRGEAEFGLNFIGAEEADIEFEPLMREPFVLVCRRDDPLSRRRKVSWEELAGHQFITMCKTSGMRVLLDLALAEVPRRPNWSYEVSHVSMLPALVEAGMGVAAIPQLAITEARHWSLVTVPLVDPVVTRTLGLMRKRGRELCPAAEELYAMIARSRPPAVKKGGSKATAISAG